MACRARAVRTRRVLGAAGSGGHRYLASTDAPYRITLLLSQDSPLAERAQCHTVGLPAESVPSSSPLVRAIEALGTIEPSGPFERALARLLIAAYKRRLRAIVKVVPTWVSEEIPSASERIGDDRAVLGMSKN
jgi:hypothetical protein